jgi:hypothetical protein
VGLKQAEGGKVSWEEKGAAARRARSGFFLDMPILAVIQGHTQPRLAETVRRCLDQE